MSRMLAVIAFLSSTLFASAAFAERCPPLPSMGGQGEEANSMGAFFADKYEVSGALKGISRGANNWNWNSRFYQCDIGDNYGCDYDRPWDTARIIINPTSKIVTINLETKPRRTVSAPGKYFQEKGFVYVEAFTEASPGKTIAMPYPGQNTSALSVCVKLWGFVAP